MDTGRMDVNDGTTGDVDGSVLAAVGPNQTGQWKLAALHTPAKTEFSDVVALFETVKLKGIELGVKHERWSVTEVSFWTEAEMTLALEKYNYKRCRGCRVNLKHSNEVKEELQKTEMYWHFLPLHVKDEILQLLAPFRWGRIFTRVSKSWKESLMSGRRSYPAGMFIDSGSQLETTSSSGSRASLKYLTRQIVKDITHLVLIRLYLHTYYEKVFKVNRQIQHLTIVKGDYFRVYVDDLWNYVDSVTLIDTIVRVATPRDGCWSLAILVPWLEATISDYKGSEDRPAEFARRLIMALYSSDLWWPYSPERTRWLRSALVQVSKCGNYGYHKREILRYLKKRNHLADSFDGKFSETRRPISSLNGAPTGIEFETYVLDQRDCAFIGMYLDRYAPYVKATNGTLPRPWRNRHFEMEEICYCDHEGGIHCEHTKKCDCKPTDWEQYLEDIRN